MKKQLTKAGILIAILVLPALVFTFLKTFGDNEFVLPYYFPELDESGHVQVSNGDTLFHMVPDFQLRNQNGEEVHLSSMGENLKVVSFFFTRCGTICPMMNKNIGRVGETFKNIPAVRLLSISIDPENDTTEVLKIYSEKMNAYSNWDFLTGDKTYIYDLAIKGFKLPVSDASVYDSGITDIDEAFIHSDKILLLDRENKVRGIYDGIEVDEINRLRGEIKVLLDGFEVQ